MERKHATTLTVADYVILRGPSADARSKGWAHSVIFQKKTSTSDSPCSRSADTSEIPTQPCMGINRI